jgi:fatty-acyl-CoA synthase
MGKSSLGEFRERVREASERIRIVTRVARQSGLMWELSLRGMGVAAKALAGEARNPSQVYRVLAANVPDKVALYWHDESLTFRDLDSRMDRVAASLSRRGMRRGTSMVNMMRNRPEFVLAGGGSSRLGVAAVSVSWRSTAQELSYLAAHCGAKAICFEHDLWPVVEPAVRAVPALVPNLFIVGLPPDAAVPAGCTRFEELLLGSEKLVVDQGAEDDAAVVIYTSGTTGKPKGAVRKFPKDAMPAAMQLIAELPMRVDDIHLVPCPLYHSTAFGFLAFTHMLGASAVLMDEFKPEPFLQAVERFGVTTTALVPTMLHRVLQLGRHYRHRSRSKRWTASETFSTTSMVRPSSGS